jgi:hypothetical protein
MAQPVPVCEETCPYAMPPKYSMSPAVAVMAPLVAVAELPVAPPLPALLRTVQAPATEQ